MKNYYDILGVSKTATEAEIKKAYKKKALEFHPDRNKGDKKAEAKFKEVNEAYQTIGDAKKRQEYDQFGTGGNPFGGMGGNPRSQRTGAGQTGAGFSGFEDIFSAFSGGGRQSQNFEFDIGDIFGGMGSQRNSTRSQPDYEEEVKKVEENLDVTETIEIPFFNFLFDNALDIRTVYGKHLTLKVKAGTKPGTKFKISGKGRTSSGKTGDMYVIVEAKMPKTPLSPTVEKMIEAIRYQV